MGYLYYPSNVTTKIFTLITTPPQPGGAVSRHHPPAGGYLSPDKAPSLAVGA